MDARLEAAATGSEQEEADGRRGGSGEGGGEGDGVPNEQSAPQVGVAQVAGVAAARTAVVVLHGLRRPVAEEHPVRPALARRAEVGGEGGGERAKHEPEQQRRRRRHDGGGRRRGGGGGGAVDGAATTSQRPGRLPRGGSDQRSRHQRRGAGRSRRRQPGAGARPQPPAASTERPEHRGHPGGAGARPGGAQALLHAYLQRAEQQPGGHRAARRRRGLLGRRVRPAGRVQGGRRGEGGEGGRRGQGGEGREEGGRAADGAQRDAAHRDDHGGTRDETDAEQPHAGEWAPHARTHARARARTHAHTTPEDSQTNHSHGSGHCFPIRDVAVVRQVALASLLGVLSDEVVVAIAESVERMRERQARTFSAQITCRLRALLSRRLSRLPAAAGGSGGGGGGVACSPAACPTDSELNDLLLTVFDGDAARVTDLIDDVSELLVGEKRAQLCLGDDVILMALARQFLDTVIGNALLACHVHFLRNSTDVRQAAPPVDGGGRKRRDSAVAAAAKQQREWSACLERVFERTCVKLHSAAVVGAGAGAGRRAGRVADSVLGTDAGRHLVALVYTRAKDKLADCSGEFDMRKQASGQKPLVLSKVHIITIVENTVNYIINMVR